MKQVAQVIVDVPTMQTDQPFTYLIPEKVQEQLQTGMRVAVPFGMGNRQVQGFVVEVTEISDDAYAQETFEWKEITAVLDLAPVLTTEMLQLADYMKETTFAFKITCLQTMLPSVMRADYQKYIYITDELPLSLQKELFGDATEVEWTAAEQAGHLPQFMRLRREQKVDIRYQVHVRNKVKTVRYLSVLLPAEALAAEKAQLRKQAVKQIALLSFLQQMSQERISVKEMSEHGFSTAVLNKAAEKGWVAFEAVETYRDPYAAQAFAATKALPLNGQQQEAVTQVTAAMAQQQPKIFLLEGITGSGKTEVYLQVIAQALEKGQTAMMLVPEIALTPQMVQRFKQRFGEQVAVMHSGLSQGEKYDEWRKVERKEANVVIGARSAIFAPVTNLGVLIMDEEHETSYKQEETPRYHARDVAIWRSQYHQCPVILGSATPSLESRARAQKHVYEHLLLTKRANQAATLPKIEIIDMRQEMQLHGNLSTFSLPLQQLLAQRLERKEQSVLLLNRRGYSSFVMCRDCGFVLPCPNCDLSLTFHMDTKSMKCHYCGHEEPVPQRCPRCRQNKIRYYGTGTQKVEEELQQLFPQSRILRMDVDTTRKKGAHQRILQQFSEEKADILLGTQMIAKGLDFPNVTLVGILNADTALHLPDFRASERTFQLLTQVSGRAGRAEKPGEVIIQSFNPEHYAIQLAKAQDYEVFYVKEMQLRHRGDYPPFYYTVQVIASHSSEQVAAKYMFQIAETLKNVLSPQAILLGPTPNAVLRMNNRYFYQIIIKYKKEPALHATLAELMTQAQKATAQGLKFSIDAEPLYFI